MTPKEFARLDDEDRERVLLGMTATLSADDRIKLAAHFLKRIFGHDMGYALVAIETLIEGGSDVTIVSNLSAHDVRECLSEAAEQMSEENRIS